MLLHRSFATFGLYETYHSVMTVRIERLVVTSLRTNKLISSIGQGVLTEFWLDIIPKVGDKPGSIFKLNSHCLVVNGGPCALHRLSVALVLRRAHLGSGLVAGVERHSHDLLILKLKLVVFVDDLHMVRLLVGAHLVRFKQIHICYIVRNVEVPSTIDFVLDAVHGLVRLYGTQQSQDCEALSHIVR